MRDRLGSRHGRHGLEKGSAITVSNLPPVIRRLQFTLSVCFAAALLLAGCEQTPVRDTTPSSDALERRIAPSMPVDMPTNAPDWLPLHGAPRVGDFVIHYRIEAQGLTRLQRRTEVMAVDDGAVEVRRTLGDSAGQATYVLHLQVDRRGRVLRAWQAADGEPVALRGSRQQHRTPLSPPEPLTLVSGSFPIDQVVSRRTTEGNASTTVYYLSAQVPFREVVSLTTQKRYRTAQLVKLLGKLSTDRTTTAAADAAIDDGWLLMHWGRGKR